MKLNTKYIPPDKILDYKKDEEKPTKEIIDRLKKIFDWYKEGGK